MLKHKYKYPMPQDKIKRFPKLKGKSLQCKVNLNSRDLNKLVQSLQHQKVENELKKKSTRLLLPFLQIPFSKLDCAFLGSAKHSSGSVRISEMNLISEQSPPKKL